MGAGGMLFVVKGREGEDHWMECTTMLGPFFPLTFFVSPDQCTAVCGQKEKVGVWKNHGLWLGSSRLQQVLIKPRRTKSVHWWQRGGGLLSLVIAHHMADSNVNPSQ